MRLSASIVIPTLNRELVLCDTLSSILSVADGSGLVEIIVVDQSATHQPETLSRLEELSENPLIKYHRVIFRGTTKARNYGTRIARGEVVIFLDDDVLTPPGFVQAHLNQYSDPSIAGIAGCVIHADEKIMGS